MALWDWLGYNTKPAGEAPSAPGGQAGGAAVGKKSLLPPEGGAAAAKKESDDDLLSKPQVTKEELERDRAIERRKKLREVAKDGGGGHPAHAVTFDKLMRNVNRLIMEGNTSDVMEFHEGVQVSTTKGFTNAQVGNKFTFGDKQTSGWDINLSMQTMIGDSVTASYNTQNRWSLQYQRPFRSGALAVFQTMLMPTPVGPQTNTFCLLQYPWAHHGTSTIQYVKKQMVEVSHTSRLIRGVHIGANMTYDMGSHDTSTTYRATTTSADKKMHWCGEVKPATGEWKVGVAKSMWHSDTEVAAQVEVKDTQQGKQSMMTVGCRKPLIGGGSLHCVMANFRRIKAQLEMPFGHDRQQVNLQYCLNYETGSGAAKHGITITL